MKEELDLEEKTDVELVGVPTEEAAGIEVLKKVVGVFVLTLAGTERSRLHITIVKVNTKTPTTFFSTWDFRQLPPWAHRRVPRPFFLPNPVLPSSFISFPRFSTWHCGYGDSHAAPLLPALITLLWTALSGQSTLP